MQVTGRSTKSVLLPILYQRANRQVAEAERMARVAGSQDYGRSTAGAVQPIDSDGMVETGSRDTAANSQPKGS